jgi:hypothetical protein
VPIEDAWISGRSGRTGCIDPGTQGSGSPFPSDSEDEEEITYDQARLIRRFRKGRRPDTVSRAHPGPAGIVLKV